MDRDTIIRLAREAGAVFSADGSRHEFETQKTLERFAVLVAEHERAAERKECAKVCDEIDRRWINQADKCAAAIRSRT